MARLQALSNELLAPIIEELPPNDKKNFSLTCRDFKTLTITHIFRSITVFTGNSNSVDQVLLAANKYGNFIWEVTVVVEPAALDWGWCEGCGIYGESDRIDALEENGMDEDDDVRFIDDERRWMGVVKPLSKLLRGDYPGYNLRKLIMEFPTEYTVRNIGVQTCASDRKAIGERTFGQIENHLAAVTENPVTSLSLRNMPPLPSSAFSDPSWATFLRRLEHLELSILYEHHDNHTDMDLEYGIRDLPPFVSGLTRNFFDHLTSVKSLRVEADSDTIIGYRSDLDAPAGAPLHLGLSNMPNLKSLELVNMVIDTPLLEFLQNRPPESEALNLKITKGWCLSFRDEDSDNRCLTWHEVFSNMMALMDDKKYVGLESFSATFYEPFVEWPAGMYTITNEQNAAYQELEILRQAAFAGEILFPYLSFEDNRSWAVRGEIVAMRDAFKSGRDQLAYNQQIERLGKTKNDSK